MARRIPLVRNMLRIFAGVMTGIIYLSFFLVQFDIHYNGSSQDISFFTCDYGVFSKHLRVAALERPQIQKNLHVCGFRLNKRFHPEDLFTIPVVSRIAGYAFAPLPRQSVLYREPIIQPPFNEPSRRGPPALV